MKKVYNDIIPVKGFKAITLWPFLFIRNGVKFGITDERHEEIHGRQQMELLIILFYVLYGIFYLIGLIRYGSGKMAYRNNPFESEAYMNEKKQTYLEKRKLFAWVCYIGKTTYSKK